MANEYILQGNEVAQDGPPRTQVWWATHTGNKITNNKNIEVYERHSYMDRSFISFSFDDPKAEDPKRIEDFDFIAYTAGDRMERDAYASFEDLTSTYDVIPGQFYWGTYFHQNTLTFDLATDGIDQEKLDAFKYWFRPGIIRELILSEHPNRAILARVSAPPRLKLLAFEHPVEMTMNNGRTYKTSTTLYKGEVELEFTMDEPFWYAKKDILGRPQVGNEYYDEMWTDVNGVDYQILDSDHPDALKIIYEDHIPIGSMANINVFYGDQIYVTMKQELYSLVAESIPESQYNEEYQPTGDALLDSAYFRWPDQDGLYYKGARIVLDNGLGGRIAGATVQEDKEGIELASFDSNGARKQAYLYYAGNAPSPVTLKFTLIPKFDGFYIISPWNKQGHPDEPYNTITLKATAEHTFKFSLPNLYRSYNNLITILKNDALVAPGNSWEAVRETIRDTIKHPKVREWANLALDKFITKDNNGIIQDSEKGAIGTLLTNISKLLVKQINTDGTIESFPASFEFNAKDGTAVGTFIIRDTSYFSENTENTKELKENVGDMVKSNYIILDERNVLTSTYQVAAWEAGGGENNSYLITHNVPNGLTQLQFIFKNMYL